MITTAGADQIIRAHRPDFGVESCHFTAANGRVLAEDITADRDFPPFDRVTMDGVAIRFADFEAGCRAFEIAAVQGAGERPIGFFPKNSCVEIMTGAVCPPGADTILQYEFLKIGDGRVAEILPQAIKKGQNIHQKGRDRRAGDVLISAGKMIGPIEINLAAAVGKTAFLIKKGPRIVVISSGDELVDAHETPLDFQIRRSNAYAIEAVLRSRGIASEVRHIPDDLEKVRAEIADCLVKFDVLIVSGGVSAGKFDHVPTALESCGVKKLFHKVRQRPGKPFWFGVFENPKPEIVGAANSKPETRNPKPIFALPGNPVSTFMCLVRYFLPWLDGAVGLPEAAPVFAVLTENVHFEPPLDYFLQVKLRSDESGRLFASPVAGNGSGDFANLLDSDGFLEMPGAARSDFGAGEVFRVWRFRGF